MADDPGWARARALTARARSIAVIAAAGRRPRGRRAVDLLIAATAIANRLSLYTRDPRDFECLGDLVDVVDVGR